MKRSAFPDASAPFNGDPSFSLLVPSPAQFAERDEGPIMQCFQEVKGWVESYEINNLGLRLSLPRMPCTSQLGIYHAVLNCRFQNRTKGPIALNVRRSSQTSNRLRQDSNHDLQTTTFGVLPASKLPPTKFECHCQHLNRLTVVDEEDLLENEKRPTTILRTHRPKLSDIGLRPMKSRLASTGLERLDSSQNDSSGPMRLKIAVRDDGRLLTLRQHAEPKRAWDVASLIWFSGGEADSAGAITFASEDRESSSALRLIRSGQRDAPFHVATIHPARTELATNGADVVRAQKTIPPLHSGRHLMHLLPFASVQYGLERVEKMGKVFHILTLTIVEPEMPSGSSSTCPLLGESTNSAAAFHDSAASTDVLSMSHELLDTLPADRSDGAKQQGLNTANTASAIRVVVRKFSFD